MFFVKLELLVQQSFIWIGHAIGSRAARNEKYVQRIEELQAGVPDNELDYFISWSDAPLQRVNWLKDAMELNETNGCRITECDQDVAYLID